MDTILAAGIKRDFENLTIKEAREIASIFSGFLGHSKAVAQENTEENFTPHIGKRCIVRTYASGVFFATIVKQNGRMVEMKDARRLWSWKAADGISLSAVAVDGVDASKCKFPQTTPAHTVLDALEIIPVSAKAAASIDETPVARAG